MNDLMSQIERARSIIAARTRLAPRIALILGSGLSELTDDLDDPVVMPYAEIPASCPRQSPVIAVNWSSACWRANQLR